MQRKPRAKRLVKVLEKLIAQEHLYTDEQLKEMNILNTKLKRGFGS